MGKYWKHFKTVTKHRYLVGLYCFKLGLIWQGLTHDLSKFSLIEFFSSARYFQGTSSPIDKERVEKGYSLAWQNHQNKNRHHWEYWIDWVKGEAIPVKMPFKYVLEMVADFISAGKTYNKEEWTPATPYEYHQRTKITRKFHKDTDSLLVLCFSIISSFGLNQGLNIIRKRKKQYKREYNSGTLCKKEH